MTDANGGGRPGGQLERSLAQLTIGIARGERDRRRALEDTHTGEHEQQVHIKLSGDATASWAFTDTAVGWELPFLYAPLQRRVPFLTPHFNYGIEITKGTDQLIIILAHLIGWRITDQQWYIGAHVRFSVCAPANDNTTTTPYAAVAHLTFQGYAATAETED